VGGVGAVGDDGGGVDGGGGAASVHATSRTVMVAATTEDSASATRRAGIAPMRVGDPTTNARQPIVEQPPRAQNPALGRSGSSSDASFSALQISRNTSPA
jgi:hypothetical protein